MDNKFKLDLQFWDECWSLQELGSPQIEKLQTISAQTSFWEYSPPQKFSVAHGAN